MGKDGCLCYPIGNSIQFSLASLSVRALIKMLSAMPPERHNKTQPNTKSSAPIRKLNDGLVYGVIMLCLMEEMAGGG